MLGSLRQLYGLACVYTPPGCRPTPRTPNGWQASVSRSVTACPKARCLTEKAWRSSSLTVKHVPVALTEAWHFSGPHLARALDIWEERDRPSEAQIEAFERWAMDVVSNGPPEDARPTLEDDEYIARVPNTDAIVTFFVVGQDRSIFLRQVERL